MNDQRVRLRSKTSKKHPVLGYIFKKYYDPRKKQSAIPFYLSDISEGYKHCHVPEPVSISNTILDLTRQDRGIFSRVPESIAKLGYDLRKKTGNDHNGKRFAGEFVFVGVGNTLKSWLLWPSKIHEIKISSSNVPLIVLRLVRPDEAGLFSVIDYCDVFSKVIYGGKKKMHRVQNPMKWQPNEIDGFYVCDAEKTLDLFPVEAKALTTGDAINFDQLQGGFRTVKEKVEGLKIKADIRPVVAKMIVNGIDIAIFPKNQLPERAEKFYRVIFEPAIPSWK